MTLLRRISDKDAERVLEGRAPSEGAGSELGEVSAFLDALRAAVPTPPPPGVEAAVVHRVAATALEADYRWATSPTRSLPAASTPRRGGWRPRVALAAKVAVAVALLPAAMAGLAFAGVTLPEPAREAMKRIGLDLPNQSAVDEEPTASGDEGDGKGDAARRSRTNRGSSRGDGSKPAGSGKRSSGGQRESGRRGQNPSADGQPGQSTSGQGTPQLGEPAPITPPGQGGTPPGQGGPAPSESAPRGAPPQTSGPPGGTAPGQAKK